MNIIRTNTLFAIAASILIGVSTALFQSSSNFSTNVVISSSFTLGVLIFLVARIIFELEKESFAAVHSYKRRLIDFCLGRETILKSDQRADVSKIFVPKIVEGAVTSRAQLGQALGDLMHLAFSHLPIKGIEVSLFDNSTSYFFFSLLMGVVPFDNRLGVFELPLSFSGKVLGSVKFCAGKETPFSENDLEIAKLLTLQVGVLFVNAEYSSELLKMQRSADETLRAKTGFLANLSHEVRAPLGVIVNATELVLDGLCGEISADQKRILGLAKNGSEHLLELIGDVLDYAKIEAGKLAPQKKDISVQEILKDLTTLIRFQAEQKKIEVVLKDGIEALAVTADRKHLRQILINLLTNAVKYTPDGGTIEVWADRAPGQMIRLNVKDSGVGIDPIHRDKVFAPFERLNHSYSRQQAGVGLGLSLAKRLAELNGGSLDYESKLGSGSRFWVLLKSTEIDIVDKNISTKNEGTPRGNGEAVVLIDPNADYRAIISKYISDLGYDLKSYTSYAEALSVLNDSQIQLLIMDNSELDDVDSNVASDISRLVQSKNISVLLLSSRAFIFDLEKYLKLGVERCLPKPVPLKELALICRQVLDSRSASIAIKRIDSPIESSSEDLLH